MDNPNPGSATLFYRLVMHASAGLFAVLAVMLFFAPRDFLAGLGLDLTQSTDFLSRRASVLILSLSAMCFGARNAASSVARQAVSLAMLVATGAMAVLGTVEFARGATTGGIFKAVAIEVVCAVCYSVIWWGGRSESTRA
jgi:hypothetical protein